MSSFTPPGNHRFVSMETTIFEIMSAAARTHDAINLGQGFPDDNGPDELRAIAAAALESHSNQYPPMMGLEVLRRAVADHDRRFYQLDYDFHREVMVTSGATEALAACFLGLLNPGDEVVVFEPLYDSYLPMIRRAGARAVAVTLSPPDWSFNAAELQTAFSEKTKLVVLNSPLNPAGKVFTADELEVLAASVRSSGALVICDEVYEHLVFSGAVHIPLATLPEMRERCVRIGSAGKTFSLTGWKVGYLRAATNVLAPIAKAHQFLTFTTPPNLQRAVAVGLGWDDGYFQTLSSQLEAKRDRLTNGLRALGFTVARCDGTYFLNAGFAAHGRADETDIDFSQRLVREAKVATIPVSAFYPSAKVNGVVRFCFCKSDDTLDGALERLEHFCHHR